MFKIDDTLILLIDFQERFVPVIFNYELLEKNIITFIKGCRILELPIITMQQYTKGLGETVQPLKDALGEFEHIEKMTFSCFGTTEFENALKAIQRTNIIVLGIEAHVCVQQTVLDLLERDYNVYVLADCIGSRKELDKIYAEKRMRQAGAVITTMESVLFELLVRADHPKRKEISNLVK